MKKGRCWPFWVGNAFLLLIEDLRKVIEDLRKVIEDLRKVIEDFHKVIEDFHKVIEDLHKVMEDPQYFSLFRQRPNIGR